MKHVMLFESFINEGRKINKDKALMILKGWAEGNLVILKKDDNGRGFWSEYGYFPDGKNSVGNLVGAVSGDNKTYYFDDNEFVAGDKTIIVVKPGKTTTKEFYDKLVDLGIVKQD